MGAYLEAAKAREDVIPHELGLLYERCETLLMKNFPVRPLSGDEEMTHAADRIEKYMGFSLANDPAHLEKEGLLGILSK